MRMSIRGKRLTVGPELRVEVERRVHLALGRFADVVRTVEVSVADVNGPHGGIDKSSRIVVQLKPTEEVVAEATDVTVLAAIDRTCYRVTRLVSRAVERAILVADQPALPQPLTGDNPTTAFTLPTFHLDLKGRPNEE